MRRLGESFAAYEAMFFQKGLKTTEFGFSHIYPDEIICPENIRKLIDIESRQWNGSIPKKYSELAQKITLIQHGFFDCCLPERTLYKSRIDSVESMPYPTTTDQAFLIAENCHSNMILENILIATAHLRVNLFRGHSFLDILSFILFRYPRPESMSGLRICSKQRFDTLLRLGGFEWDSDAGTNTVDVYKGKAARFIRAWCRAHSADLQVDNDWIREILPRPNMARYGVTVIPPLSQADDVWSACSVSKTLAERNALATSSSSTSVHQICKMAANVFMSALGVNVVFRVMDRDASVEVSTDEVQQLLKRWAAVLCGSGARQCCTGIVVNQTSERISLEFVVQSDQAESKLATYCPFGTLRSPSEDGSQHYQATTPAFCVAFDRLRQFGCSINTQKTEFGEAIIAMMLPQTTVTSRTDN